jgi:hypothetical protein
MRWFFGLRCELPARSKLQQRAKLVTFSRITWPDHWNDPEQTRNMPDAGRRKKLELGFCTWKTADREAECWRSGVEMTLVWLHD